MNILINTSNLYVGGGVQVALSFIRELKKFETDNRYHIFCSPEIHKQLSSNRGQVTTTIYNFFYAILSKRRRGKLCPENPE